MAANIPTCGDQPSPRDAPLCGHSPEQFAEAAMMLEPRGPMWVKSPTLLRSALYRAFGGLLAAFEQRLCDLFNESLACDSVELLSEWEAEYGLPGDCADGYPTTLEGRQAQVCAARLGMGIQTLAELQDLLRKATGCEYLTLNQSQPPQASAFGESLGSVIRSAFDNPIETPSQTAFTQRNEGLCISGIRSPAQTPAIHNVVGGWGPNSGPSAQGYGSAPAQPLTLTDPQYVPPPVCNMVDHARVGGHTGGAGRPLTQGDDRFALMRCLLNKHLPAHVAWYVCD